MDVYHVDCDIFDYDLLNHHVFDWWPEFVGSSHRSGSSRSVGRTNRSGIKRDAMSRSISNALLRLGLIILFALAAANIASAQSNCANINNTALLGPTTITATPAYQPFSGLPRTASFNLTVQNNNGGACSIALIIVRPTAPLLMTNGASTLNYNLDFNGNPVVNFGAPSTGWFLTAPGSGTGTFSTYNLTIPANQTAAAAGAYADNDVLVYLYAYRFGWNFVRTYALRLRATIDQTCVMSAPSPATLDFTSAISLGLPNAAVVLSSSIGGVNCTSASRVTVSGAMMQRTPAVGAIPGLDNFIHWQATASLGSASATLSTNAGSSTTSASYNVLSGTTVGGVVGVDVNLIQGQPLQSGNYTGVLTVTVDPTL